MRAVVQRVKECKVLVKGENIGKIDSGLLIFLGIGQDDEEQDADYLIDKIINLRIFADEEGKMNLSALELGKDIMVVSQFTLYGDCRQGKRPSFSAAASPGRAEKLYNYFVEGISCSDLKIATGQFKAMMDVEFVNDGPVTILLASNKEF